jgi:hypothetical protein
MVERGFVPPAAKRKLAARENKRRRESRKTFILLALVVTFGLLFIVYNVRYIRRSRSAEKALGKAEIGLRQVLSESSSKLRGGKAWVSQNSQPFVSKVDSGLWQ